MTSVAALQLVEQGRPRLDEPAADIDPSLASAEVLAGFGANDVPRLRLAKIASRCANFCRIFALRPG